MNLGSLCYTAAVARLWLCGSWGKQTWPAKPPPSAQHDRPLDSHNRSAGAGGVFEDGAMTTEDLTALAERVMALAGPCRETDRAILLALGYSWRGMAYWFRDDSHRWKGDTHFTASLDAAMTLTKTDAEACAVLHEAMDALSRDCPTQGNWRAHLPRYVVAEFIRVRLAQVQP